jgi:inosine/xanthosine triphosphate pyrophosphatase family protein
MAPKELNFITGNKNKLAEVQAILSETPVKLQSQAVDLVEIQGTIEEISTDKARRAAEAVCCVTCRFFWRPVDGFPFGLLRSSEHWKC